jgi:8-amino-7-oxononanoate synthase
MKLEAHRLAEMSPEEKRAVAKQLLREQAGHTSAVATLSTARGRTTAWTGTDVPEEFYRFELFPGYRALLQQGEVMQRFGIINPYFNCHEDVSNDTLCIAQRQYINYSGYNYLGLSGDPAVSQAAKAAIDQYGTSVSASRMVSGDIPLHRELEQALADLIGTESCVVFVSGYGTNVSTIGHLCGPKDLILHDSLIHNSVLTGCKLSGARRLPFPHNDWLALDRLLAENRRYHERVLIAIEGVYSMDGDIPDLPEFLEVKQRHKALLMVDEAHSIGVLGPHGRGLSEHFHVPGTAVDIWMGTLSKAFASCGGYIAGNRALIEYLRYMAPGGVLYSVGMSPPNAAAALAALRRLQEEPALVTRLQAQARLFFSLAQEHGLNTGLSGGSAIVPVILGNSLQSLQLGQELFERGINVQPVLYPAVPEEASRLRFFLTARHSAEQIRFTVQTVAEQLQTVRRDFALSVLQST